MFNKRLLASITLDKKKLKKSVENSCIIECIPTVRTLTETELRELRDCLNRATDILRRSYLRADEHNKFKK